MKVKRLSISQLRNLNNVQFSFSEQKTLFYGPNGIGKTTVLEAFALLGRGRSFRSLLAKELVSHHSSELVVFGELEDSYGAAQQIGISKKTNGETQCRLNGEKATQADLLAKMPLQIITAQSFSLLTGQPKERRQLLDWGMFHVEHSYLKEWRAYQRAMKQRMEALRQGSACGPWEKEMADHAYALTLAREQYMKPLLDHLCDLLGRHLPHLAIDLSFKRGWPQEKDLLKLLEETRGGDLLMGFTRAGPHRADLSFVCYRSSVGKVLSRGQQKIFIVLLQLAQARVLMEKTQKKSIWLLDDVASELDPKNREALLQELEDTQQQLFMTACEPDRGAKVGEQYYFLGQSLPSIIEPELV